MWIKFNPNPDASRVGDCSVRAVACALDQDWYKTYLDMAVYGIMKCDMPSANAVWGAYLKDKGFKRHIVPDQCPECYSVDEFAADHPQGVYVLGLNGHVVTVKDGNYFDTWDSGNEIPVYYWRRE